jgi:hypothetical protein
MIYNWKPYFTLKDSVMDPSYDGPDMWCVRSLGWSWLADTHAARSSEDSGYQLGMM